MATIPLQAAPRTATLRDAAPSAERIGPVILAVEHVSLRFGGVKAISDVSFSVREHEVLAIIGPNGAGKSSMLNCINGVYRPQQGTIRFKDEPFSVMTPHRAASMGIARTFQNLALFKGMTVLDNIMTGRNLRMRAGIHSGRPSLTETGYVGLAVHAAARICYGAHGGQIVLSAAARSALPDPLAEGLKLRSLGSWRFQGLREAHELFQVEAHGLALEFPPLRSGVKL